MIQNAGGIIPIYKHKRATYKAATLNSEHITQHNRGCILNYEGVTQKSRVRNKIMWVKHKVLRISLKIIGLTH